MFFQGMAALLVLVVMFVFTEGQAWHRPTFEFIFWVVILWAGTSLALLAPDSPVLFFVSVNRHPASLAVVFGAAVPLYCAVVVQGFIESGLVSFQQHRGSHFQERLLEIQRLSRAQATGSAAQASARRSRRTSSAFLDASVVDEKDFVARSKQQYVSRTLDRLVFTSQLRHFAAWMRGQIDERQEALRKVIQESTADELNHIIGTINVPKLFRHGTNSGKINNVLQYLMEERHSDLTTIARASVLHGLMRTQTLQFFVNQMEWSVTVFSGAKGAELTLLKNMLDSSGDFNNLFKLVYNDIAKPELRKKMLKHIKEEAKKVLKENTARGHFPIKVLSDVDDTLSCSGGSFPAGADPRYPRHAVYPGVLALYEEIDMAARASSNEEPEGEGTLHRRATKVNVEVHVPWQQGGGVFDMECSAKETVMQIQDSVQGRFNVLPDKQKLTITNKRAKASMEDNVDLWKDGNLVFVSARPHVFKDVAENGSYRRFHKLINEGRMHCTPTMLSGSLSSGTLAVVFRFWEKLQLLAIDLQEFSLAMFSSLKENAKKRAKSRRKKGAAKGSISLLQEDGVEDDDDEGGIDGINATELNRSESSFGMRNITNRNWTAVGRQKVESIEKYSVLFPEYELVFFGDNGQGDLLTAELISTREPVKEKVRMCFIHKVQSNDDESLLSSFPRSEREERWQECRIVFFETYVEAATLAFEHGLISARGLHRVGLSVHDELLEFFVKYPHRDWTVVYQQTKRDIRRANKILRSIQSDLVIPVPILPQSFIAQ